MGSVQDRDVEVDDFERWSGSVLVVVDNVKDQVVGFDIHMSHCEPSMEKVDSSRELVTERHSMPFQVSPFFMPDISAN